MMTSQVTELKSRRQTPPKLAIPMAKPSAFQRITSATEALRREGVDVISLAMGESGFSTPEWISDAACRAVSTGQMRYTEMTGTFALKEAVRQKYERENDLRYEIDEILISTGATQALSNVMRATLHPGDEVILLVPYYSPYADMIVAQGGVPVCVPASDDTGGVPLAALEAAITARTRWIILNSPCNPSGVVLSTADLAALAVLLRRHPDILIISDDIYEKTVFEGAAKNVVNVAPDLKDRTVVVNGVSKTYAMTGWRIGYALGPRDLMAAMGYVQTISSWTPSAVGQIAAEAALNGPQEFIESWRQAYSRRRDILVGFLNEIEGLSCRSPSGAFYAFPCIEKLIGRRTPGGTVIEDDVALATYLLNSAAVSTVPGSIFGARHHLRMSFVVSEGQLTAACQRIASAIVRLS